MDPSPSLVMGVDIDSSLIASAEFALRGAWTTWAPRPLESLQKQHGLVTRLGASETEANYQGTGLETGQGKSTEQSTPRNISLPQEASYFPSSFSTLFGALPLPPPASNETESLSSHFGHKVAESSIGQENLELTDQESNSSSFTRFPHNVRFLIVDWMEEIQGLKPHSETSKSVTNRLIKEDGDKNHVQETFETQAASIEMMFENRKGWDLILG